MLHARQEFRMVATGFTFRITYNSHVNKIMEEEMATHSSILAWRIPWTEESGRLQSVGSQEPNTT